MGFDAKAEIRSFLRERGILGLSKKQGLAALAQAVARIPWGEGRNIEEVLSTKKVGTCTGKHLVLQACLDELGIGYRPVVCTFRWGEQGIDYPQNLREILSEGEWEHGHNFVQIKNPDGGYVDLDITWNPELKPYGFKPLPEDWDGQPPFVGIDNIVRRWDGPDISTVRAYFQFVDKSVRMWERVDIRDMKKALIETLNPELRERRERFLRELIKWIGTINSNL